MWSRCSVANLWILKGKDSMFLSSSVSIMMLAANLELTRLALRELWPSQKSNPNLWEANITMNTEPSPLWTNPKSSEMSEELSPNFISLWPITTIGKINGIAKVDKCPNFHTSPDANLHPKYTKAKIRTPLMSKFRSKEAQELHQTYSKLKSISKAIKSLSKSTKRRHKWQKHNSTNVFNFKTTKITTNSKSWDLNLKPKNNKNP